MTYRREIRNNCAVAQTIASSVKTLLGPSQSVKLLISEDDYQICGNTAKILQFMDIQHPAGYLVNDSCQGLYKDCGTGCTSLVCLIGFWSSAAQEIVDKGVPVPLVVHLFHEAVNHCRERLKEIAIPLKNITFSCTDHSAKYVPIKHGTEEEYYSRTIPAAAYPAHGPRSSSLMEGTHNSVYSDGNSSSSSQHRISSAVVSDLPSDNNVSNDEVSGSKEECQQARIVQTVSRTDKKRTILSHDRKHRIDIKPVVEGVKTGFVPDRHVAKVPSTATQLGSTPTKDDDIAWYFDGHLPTVPSLKAFLTDLGVPSGGLAVHLGQGDVSGTVSLALSNQINSNFVGEGVHSDEEWNKSEFVCDDWEQSDDEFTECFKSIDPLLDVDSVVVQSETSLPITSSCSREVSFQSVRHSGISQISLTAENESSDDEFDACYEEIDQANAVDSKIEKTKKNKYLDICLYHDQPKTLVQDGSTQNKKKPVDNSQRFHSTDSLAVCDSLQQFNCSESNPSGATKEMVLIDLQRKMSHCTTQDMRNQSEHNVIDYSSKQRQDDSIEQNLQQIVQCTSAESKVASTTRLGEAQKGITVSSVHGTQTCAKVTSQLLIETNSGGSIRNAGCANVDSAESIEQKLKGILQAKNVESKETWKMRLAEVQRGSRHFNNDPADLREGPSSHGAQTSMNITSQKFGETNSPDVVRKADCANLEPVDSIRIEQKLQQILKFKNVESKATRKKLLAEVQRGSRHFKTDSEDLREVTSTHGAQTSMNFEQIEKCFTEEIPCVSQHFKKGPMKVSELCNIALVDQKTQRTTVTQLSTQTTYDSVVKLNSCDRKHRDLEFVRGSKCLARSNTLIKGILCDEYPLIDTVSQGLSHGKELEMSLANQVLKIQLNNSNVGLLEGFRLNLDLIHCETVVGPPSSHSSLKDGLVIRVQDKDHIIFSKVRNDNSFSVILINGDVKPNSHHTGYKSFTEKISKTVTHKQVLNTSKETAWNTRVSNILTSLGIGLVVAKGEVDTDFVDDCHEMGVSVLCEASYRQLQLLSSTTGGNILSYITDAQDSDIGEKVTLQFWDAGWEPSRTRDMKNKSLNKKTPSYVVLNQTGGVRSRSRASICLQTVLITAPVKNLLMESELKFWNCVHRLRNVLEAQCVLPGRGESELECIRHLEHIVSGKRSVSQSETMSCALWVTSQSKMFRPIVYDAFIQGLRQFVCTTLQNSGKHETIEQVLEQISNHNQQNEHQNGQQNEHQNGQQNEHQNGQQNEHQNGHLACSLHESDHLTEADQSCFCLISQDPYKVFDDYKVKIESWERAIGVLATLLQSDFHIITGGECRKDSSKSIPSGVSYL